MKKFLGILAIICACFGMIWAFVMIDVKISNQKYEEALLKTPDINYVEEDLEIVFISTGVIVLSYEQQDEIIIYLVEVEDRQYLVLYQLKVKNEIMFKCYCWEYVSYRML